jgi:hypothetical protein
MMVRDASHRFVFAEYNATPESLSIFRLLFALLFLALFVPNKQWIAQFPDSFFNPPPGLTYFFVTGFPPQWFFVALNVIEIVAAVYLLAGRHVMPASLLVTGCLLIGNAWAYSFGKIDHDILMVIVPIFLVAAGWDGRSTVRAWPLALFALVIALAMFTAAWQKAVTGWLDPTRSEVFGYALTNAIFLESRNTISWRLAVRTVPDAVWEMMDYATVLLEASFVVAVYRRRAFRALCALACLFHLGVTLMMRILFVPNLIAYAAFVRWDVMATRLKVRDALAHMQRWLAGRTDLQLLTAAAALSAIDLSWGNPMSVLLAWARPGIALSWIAAIGAFIFLISQLRAGVLARQRTRVGASEGAH